MHSKSPILFCHPASEDEEYELRVTSSLLHMPFKYNNNNTMKLGRDPLFMSAGPGSKQNTEIFVHAQMRL